MMMCETCRGTDWTLPHECQGNCACFCQVEALIGRGEGESWELAWLEGLDERP